MIRDSSGWTRTRTRRSSTTISTATIVPTRSKPPASTATSCSFRRTSWPSSRSSIRSVREAARFIFLPPTRASIEWSPRWAARKTAKDAGGRDSVSSWSFSSLIRSRAVASEADSLPFFSSRETICLRKATSSLWPGSDMGSSLSNPSILEPCATRREWLLAQ
jgi:hypothetical protein